MSTNNKLKTKINGKIKIKDVIEEKVYAINIHISVNRNFSNKYKFGYKISLLSFCSWVHGR